MRVTPPAASTLISDRGYDSNWFRQTQGLAAYRLKLRSMRPHRFLGYLHRSSRRLLSQSMSPQPNRSNVVG